LPGQAKTTKIDIVQNNSNRNKVVVLRGRGGPQQKASCHVHCSGTPHRRLCPCPCPVNCSYSPILASRAWPWWLAAPSVSVRPLGTPRTRAALQQHRRSRMRGSPTDHRALGSGACQKVAGRRSRQQTCMGVRRPSLRPLLPASSIPFGCAAAPGSTTESG
jgi:hypothetical protein